MPPQHGGASSRMVYDMSSTPITVTSVPRTTQAVYYDGTNRGGISALAEATMQSVAGSKGSLRVWSVQDNGQRVLEPGTWVIIDLEGELISIPPGIFDEHWSANAESATAAYVDHIIIDDPLPQAPPTSWDSAPVDFGADKVMFEMTQDEFLARKADTTFAIPDSLEGDEAAAGEEPPTVTPAAAPNDTPGPTSKKEWIERRVEQGYSSNAMAKLSIPILAVLPDTPPV